MRADSYSIGATNFGSWVFTDITTAGDHPSIGIRASGNNSGGTTVNTVTGSENFLNGGRSAIFSHALGVIQ